MPFILAQNMPGMEWYFLMLLVTGVGLLCGAVAIILRTLPFSTQAGWQLGKVAVGIGLASPILFLPLVRANMFPIGYVFLMASVLPGTAALAMRPTKFMRAIVLVAIVASVSLFYWSFYGKYQVLGLTVEEPAEFNSSEAPAAFGPVSDDRPPQNMFAQPKTDDPEVDQIIQACQLPTGPGANVSVDLEALSEFSGAHRQLLLRHFATSCKWRLRHFGQPDGGKWPLIATRRYVLGGMWQNPNLGRSSYSIFAWPKPFDGIGNFGIVLGIDGDFGDSDQASATVVSPSTQPAVLPVHDEKETGFTNISRLIVRSSGASVESYEDSPRPDRIATNLLLSQLNDEIKAVLASPTAKDHGFDPALMPKESIRRGPPEMHLAIRGGARYQVLAYVNPGESGYLYVRAFEAAGNNLILWNTNEEGNKGSNECTGWSDDPQEQFYRNHGARHRWIRLPYPRASRNLVCPRLRQAGAQTAREAFQR